MTIIFECACKGQIEKTVSSVKRDKKDTRDTVEETLERTVAPATAARPFADVHCRIQVM